MIVLDTNVLSELMRPAPFEGVIRWLDAQPVTGLYISAITKAEIELGIELLPDGKRKAGLALASGEMFQDFAGRCLSFDETAAAHYAKLVSVRIKTGHPVSVEDAQIAAIALAHRFALATRNTKDFQGIPGLDLINPWQISAI